MIIVINFILEVRQSEHKELMQLPYFFFTSKCHGVDWNPDNLSPEPSLLLIAWHSQM